MKYKNKHMNRCSKSSVIRETQIETINTMRYNFVSAKKKALIRMWRNRMLIRCWWECKMVHLLWKRVWQFLRKLNMELPYGPGISFLNTQKRNENTCPHKNSIWVFITPLFIIAKKYKQLKCPSIDEWINKMCDSHGRILFSNTKEMLNTDTCYNIHIV